MAKRTPRYAPEVRARAVRMVLDRQGEHGSQHAAIRSTAAKIGCSGETLRKAVELRRCETRRCLPEDLVSLAQLTALALQRTQALALVRGRPSS